MAAAAEEQEVTARTTAAPGDDRISQLPECILHTILLALPLKEAGATTVLSKRWRYLFHSIPILVLEDESFPSSDPHVFRVDHDRWIEAVLRILGSRRDPVECCVISIAFFRQHEEAFGMITRALCDVGVRELSIWNHQSDEYYYQIPSHVLSCGTLNRLDLKRCRLPVPPSFAGLCHLQALWLYDVVMTDDQIERLVSCCRALEILSLAYCPRISNLVIRAPSLAVLEVCTRRPTRISIEKAPLLSSVTARFRFRPKHYDELSIGADYSENLNKSVEEESEVSRLIELLEGLGHVEILSLAFQLLYAERLEKDGKRIPRSLASGHHLVKLKQLFLRMDINNGNLLSIMSCLLNSTPCLQELVIGGHWFDGCAEMAEPDYWNKKIRSECLAKWPSTTTLCVESEFIKHWIGFAKFLLMNVCTLKKMTVVCLLPEESSALEDARKELLLFPKASLDVVVELTPLRFGMRLC